MLKDKVPEAFARTVAERMAYAMEERDMPAKELARRADVCYNSVLSWLRYDRVPNSWPLFKISKVLGVSADWLMGRDDL